MPPALDKQSLALHPAKRFVGIDVGAETIKVVELLARDGTLVRGRTTVIEHHKHPGPALLEALAGFDWSTVSGAAVSGRLSRAVRLPRIPTKQAQARGFRFLFDDRPATVVNIGSHGFTVLELRAGGLEVLRENSRCSQGTGNFLRQLTERFNLTPAQASELCAEVAKAAPLSGRCPVILKTDMTHLANKGGDRAAILAGLFDAVCENVMVLVKPGISPARVALFGGVTQSRRIRRTLAAMLAAQQMELLPVPEDEAVLLEATGCAVLAAESPAPVPPLGQLLAAPPAARLDWTPPLRDALQQVRRMPPQPLAERNGRARELLLGLDIGSTGSKAVALDADSAEVLWEGYRRTAGDPVGAEGKFVFTMPGGNGPCRFGVYNLLNALTLERTGLRDRVRIWAPHERGYFDKLPPGFGLLVFTGFTVADALLEMLLEVRPVETRPGAADEIYQRANTELLRRMQAQASRPLGLARSLWEVSGGGLFGLRELVSSAAREFAAVRSDREIPTALVVGEIYVRSNPFANDHVVARLEERGLRARLVPCSEFVEYVDHVNRHDEGRNALGDRVSSAAQERVRRVAHGLAARELGGPARVRVRETLAAARDYVPEALQGEAVLTVGAALHHWRAGDIDAVVNVGPLECMPSKVAEAQFFHIARREGLPALTLALNGEPMNTETLDNFAFEVWERFRGRRDARAGGMSLVSPQGRGQTVGA